jgi:hypothetical protein
MLLDILIAILLLLAVAALVVVLVAAWLMLPLSDLLNALVRRIGLAGPSPRTRTIGMHNHGTICEPFEPSHDGKTAVCKVFVKGEIWNAHCDVSLAQHLVEGDEVEIIYDQELSVTIVQKVE